MTATTVPPSKSAEKALLTPADHAFIEELVRTRIAVRLEGKAYLIESRLGPVARLHKLDSVAELVEQARRNRNGALAAGLIEAMTTNETSFFRDKHPFTALTDHIIPELVASATGRPTLTIWNAACSSGQESLSVAMLINEKFPELATRQRTKIVATDVSPAMVTRCREGIYSRFEINRGLPANLATKYFEPSGRNWMAKRELRDLLETRELNLIERWSGLPKCDVVMLRNVLIYFPPEIKSDILRRVRTDVLKPGGTLLLGASESTAGIDPGFESKHVAGSTIFVPKGDIK